MIPPVGRRVARREQLEVEHFDVGVDSVGVWSIMVASKSAWELIPAASRPKFFASSGDVVLGLTPPADVLCASPLKIFTPR